MYQDHHFTLQDEARSFDVSDKFPVLGNEGVIPAGTIGELGNFVEGEWDEHGNPCHKNELVEFKPLGHADYVLIEAKHVNFAS